MSGEEKAGPPVGIDRDMEMVFGGIEALRELAANPEKSREDARVYDFSIRWGVLLSGRLKRLEHYYRAGELAEGQEHDYRRLRRELEGVVTMIERLGVGKPDIPLDD